MENKGENARLGKIFFTADQHFGHKNIAKYTERPWKEVNEMDRQLIFNHNQVVKEEDTVYHIGDFAWGTASYKIENILSRMNGTHHLILGNHDLLRPFTYVNCGFTSVHTSLTLTFDDVLLVLAHDPSVSQVAVNIMFLCGHIHRLFNVQGNCLNVGIDIWEYLPVSLDMVLTIAKEFYKEKK